MIHVIASIFIKKNKISQVKKIYETFTPQVNKESGCIMYLPTVDHQTDIPTQSSEPNMITVIEQWKDMDAFRAHLYAPHVIEFRKEAKSLIEKISIKVLKPGLD